MTKHIIATLSLITVFILTIVISSSAMASMTYETNYRMQGSIDMSTGQMSSGSNKDQENERDQGVNPVSKVDNSWNDKLSNSTTSAGLIDTGILNGGKLEKAMQNLDLIRTIVLFAPINTNMKEGVAEHSLEDVSSKILTAVINDHYLIGEDIEPEKFSGINSDISKRYIFINAQTTGRLKTP